MLVLTRKLHEAIQIGDSIEIKIVAIDGDQIKLGISAPRDVEILRQEIYEHILEENTAAANVPAHLLEALKHKA
ncbi:carbon storage regulator CsrA [Aureibacillus halotolerans]|uniref:Translational regulator CsrA n=1 Tax=Aureibacillus halotolerans TaxID=1508390 RepID=A0A4R6TX99_9BACI|nr:carbon storage regulator CsrA [Aureibacillus halotolerans]TDQ36933.1 carbon storage regulator CsrA [Aureibacillus halotolerans]